MVLSDAHAALASARTAVEACANHPCSMKMFARAVRHLRPLDYMVRLGVDPHDELERALVALRLLRLARCASV